METDFFTGGDATRGRGFKFQEKTTPEHLKLLETGNASALGSRGFALDFGRHGDLAGGHGALTPGTGCLRRFLRRRRGFLCRAQRDRQDLLHGVHVPEHHPVEDAHADLFDVAPVQASAG